MDKKNLMYLIVLVLFLVSGTGAQPVNPVNNQADGVDFLLLIDESGSMCGSKVHPGRNDPMNKRNTFMKLILPDICKATESGKRYRISMIEFGSRYGSSDQWKAKVTLSAHQIPLRLPSESKDNYFNRVSNELEDFTKDRNRGDSDHGEALRLAVHEIQKLGNIPVPVPIGQKGVQKRLKVVFMLTDGKPYVKKREESAVGQVELQREIEKMVANFPNNEVILYVLGLNSSDDYWYTGGYGSFWDDVAGSTTDKKGKHGYSQFIMNYKEMYQQILPILLSHIETLPPPPPPGGKYDCPPYLKSIEITLEFSKNYMKLDDMISIIQPNGQILPNHYFQEEKTYARLKVDYPLPGIWTFKREPGIEVMVKEVAGSAEYISPVSPVSIGTEEKIIFKVPGTMPNQNFTLLPGFPIEGRISVLLPDHSEKILNAFTDPNTPGHFISTQPFKFQHEGGYNIRFTGSVITGTGEKTTVIDSGQKEITAAVIDRTGEKPHVIDPKKSKIKAGKASTHPVKILLEEPGSVSSLLGSINEKIYISFYNGKHKIPLDQLLMDKAKIQVEFVLTMGGRRISPIHNTTLDQQTYTLSGYVEGNISWRYLFDLLLGRIDGKLTLKLDNRMLRQGYILEDPGTSSNLYEVLLDVREPFWFYLLILISIAALAYIPYYFFTKTKAAELSKDIPLLVYRQSKKIDRDESVEKELTIFKKKMVFEKNLKKAFDVPGMSDRWEPELVITRVPVPMGVKVIVKYERFKANRLDKNRFEEVIMETIDNDNPAQHHIVGLEQMMFELQIKK